MKIIKGGRAGGPVMGNLDTFTGSVWVDSALGQTQGVRIDSVAFSPAARTHWHLHSRGQVLIVSSGAGWVEDRDGDGGEITAGDVVFIPPGLEHWHGAQPDTVMVHLAISLGEVRWLEAVSEEDYAS